MDPQLLKTCAQTIYWADESTVSSTGVPTYGSPYAVSARVEPSNADAEGIAGGEPQTRHLLILPTVKQDGTTFTPTVSGRVWMPDDSSADATLGRKPLSVVMLPDERGAADHYEVVL